MYRSCYTNGSLSSHRLYLCASYDSWNEDQLFTLMVLLTFGEIM